MYLIAFIFSLLFLCIYFPVYHLYLFVCFVCSLGYDYHPHFLLRFFLFIYFATKCIIFIFVFIYCICIYSAITILSHSNCCIHSFIFSLIATVIQQIHNNSLDSKNQRSYRKIILILSLHPSLLLSFVTGLSRRK